MTPAKPLVKRFVTESYVYDGQKQLARLPDIVTWNIHIDDLRNQLRRQAAHYIECGLGSPLFITREEL